MKKIVVFGLIVLGLFSCKSTEEIFPLDKESRFKKMNRKIPSRVKYFKDINNVLSNFTGTWKGNYKNRDYEFRISKDTFIRYNGIKQDVLKMEYRTVQEKQVFTSATNFLTMNQFIISDYYNKNTLGKTNTFLYETLECGQAGQITLMKYKNMKDNEMVIYYFSPPQGTSTSDKCTKIPLELQFSRTILYKE